MKKHTAIKLAQRIERENHTCETMYYKTWGTGNDYEVKVNNVHNIRPVVFSSVQEYEIKGI